MKREFRLRGERPFKMLFQNGKRIQTPSFLIIYRRNQEARARVSCIIPKKTIRSAVLRNRIRRRIYEWIRQQTTLLAKPIDVAIVIQKPACAVSRKQLYEELEQKTKEIVL